MTKKAKEVIGNLFGIALIVAISCWIGITALPLSSLIATIILLNIHSIICFFIGLIIILIVWIVSVLVMLLMAE